MTSAPYTVVVNTSDGYQDCWDPFFRLFARHWPDCKALVCLNTEREDWHCPDRPVRCLQSARGHSGPRPSWSELLHRALGNIDTPLVLYLQEDYFLQAPVNSSVVDELANEMIKDPRIAHIGLTHFGSQGPFEETQDRRLWKISQDARYRVSTQAGLWRTHLLRSYLFPGENGWMFEILGSWRARRRREMFLTVNREIFAPDSRVIDYLHTGIIKGRWHRDLPAVFQRFGIELNFELRGFYRERCWALRRLETFAALATSPKNLFKVLTRGIG